MSYLNYDGSAATDTAAPTSSAYANAAGQTLTGTGGPDGLWASGGNDTLIGGAGDDTFYLQSAGNHIIDQPGAGTDQIVTWSNASLANYPNVANLVQDGDGVYAVGNSADNIITAGAGRVELYGNGGQDVLVGGTGQDTFDIIKGAGNDAIYGFKPSTDIIRLSAGYTDFSQVQAHMTQTGADVKIDLGGSDGVIIRNTQVSQLTATNFELQIDPSKIGQMTFHDEFNGNSLSVWNATYNPTGTWRPDYGYQGADGVGSYTLTGNNEQQVYTSPYFRDHAGDFPSPFSEANGALTITASPATAAESSELFGYNYTSGMISTKESFAQTYGYFEMRADLPHGNGGWPAFWLVPADGSWPPELDVMETLTGDGHVDYTTEHTMETGTHTSSSISSYIPDTSDGFHTYGVLWTKTDLVWYVDGVEVFHTATPTDMNKPMYMIANLALGGWSGTIDNASMPEQMKIDYIRSYALADGSSTVQGFDAGQASGSYTTTVSPPAAGSGTSTPVTTSPPPPADPGTTTTTTTTTPTSSTEGHVFTSQGGDTLTGTAGADTFNAGAAPTTLTGGAGADHFVFSAEPWAPTHITDFTVGQDVLDLSALLKTAGYTGSDPVADHYVVLQSDGNGGTEVLFNPDGPGAAAHPWPDYIINLDHTVATTWAQLEGASTAPTTTTSPPPATSTPSIPGEVLTSAHVGDTLIGGAGDDTLNASQGNDVLTGGGGDNLFVFQNEPWAPDTITDFQEGHDKLDLRGIFAKIGYTGSDPVADHYLSFGSDGHGGTAVMVDDTGSTTGNPWPNYIIDLQHVDPSTLTSSDWIIR